jgi:acyl-CoA hydrolase
VRTNPLFGDESYEGEHCPFAMEPYSKEPVTLIEEVFPQDTNAYDTLFGGRLLSLMDKAGGIACAKFAHREFVTISIDTLKFIAPARQGDLLEVIGKVVFTSEHTACAKVSAYTMSKATWQRTIICEGFFFFVAIDSMMRPIPIPQFIAETDDEQVDWNKAQAIRTNMLNG